MTKDVVKMDSVMVMILDSEHSGGGEQVPKELCTLCCLMMLHATMMIAGIFNRSSLGQSFG